MDQRWKGPTSITTPPRVQPISRFCTVMCGSRFRWRYGIRCGVRWPCPSGRCCMFGRRPWRSIPKGRGWQRFATKLQLAARLVEWIVPILKNAGKTVSIVVDGGYTKAAVLEASAETSGGRGRRSFAERRGACAIGRPSSSRDNAVVAVGHASTAKEKSAWPNEPVSRVAGKPSNALSTARLARKRTRPSWPPTLRRLRDSRGAGEGRAWLVRLLLHRSGGKCPRDSRSVCRSCYHRTRLSRRERGLGERPTAGPQHLEQSGGVQLESLDAYVGGTVGLEQKRHRS